MKQIIVRRRTGNIGEVLFTQLLYNSQEISDVLRDVTTTNMLGVKTNLILFPQTTTIQKHLQKASDSNLRTVTVFKKSLEFQNMRIFKT